MKQVNLYQYTYKILTEKKSYFFALIFFGLFNGTLLGYLGTSLDSLPASPLLTAVFTLGIVVSFRFTMEIASLYVTNRLYKESKLKVLKGSLKSMEQIKSYFSPTETLERMTFDYPILIDTIFGVSTEIVTQFVVAIVLSIFLLLTSAKDLFLIIGFGGALFLFSLALRWGQRKFFAKDRSLESQIFVKEKNIIDGYEYLKASSHLSREEDRYEKLLGDWFENTKKGSAFDGAFSVFTWALWYIVILLVATPYLKALDFSKENFYWAYLLFACFSRVGASVYRWSKAQVHWDRVKDILLFKPNLDKRRFNNQGYFQAKDLKISFDPRQWEDSLVGLTFDWGKGKHILVNGESGIGKTTLLRVLMGQSSHFKGELCVPCPRQLKVSFVPQDPFFYDGESLGVNLGIEVLKDEHKEMILNLNLGPFFESVQYNLKCSFGQEGILPSKGQKTRLAILRELLREPDVLILDEPTAGLDSVTAEMVVTYVKKLCVGKTIVLSEHHKEIFNWFNPDEVLSLQNYKAQKKVETNGITTRL